MGPLIPGPATPTEELAERLDAYRIARRELREADVSHEASDVLELAQWLHGN